MKPFKWLTIAEVLSIHKDQILENGGIGGLRDMGLLESSLARPRNSFSYEPNRDIFDIAAEYAYGIIRNHPFIDGNKRTAFATAAIFLLANNYALNKEKNNEQNELVHNLASGKTPKNDFANFLRKNARSIIQEVEINPINKISETISKKPHSR